MGKDTKESESKGQGVSRRGFLKAGLSGAAAIPFAGIKTDLGAAGVKTAEKRTSSLKTRAAQGMMIDTFCHIMPPKYMEALNKKSKGSLSASLTGRFGMPSMPSMFDAENRLRLMDRYEGYVQILNISLPPPEDTLSPQDAVEVCKIANDGLAELVYKYPDRFVAATACLPLNDMDAAIKELDRAILDLRLKGIQINSTIMDKPLDAPEFQPLFEKMNHYNLPIQLHPRYMQLGPRAMERAPYKDEVGVWAQLPLAWPYETSIAMGRLAFSGMMEKYQNLKIITHHLGGFVPYHSERISHWHNTSSNRYGSGSLSRYYTRPILDYYRMMYGDTACYGRTATLMDGYAFFGADHVLFATDAPYDAANGDVFIRETINSVLEMDISDEDRKKIFEDNARRLFRLPV
jgi:uncharacterized protein